MNAVIEEVRNLLKDSYPEITTLIDSFESDEAIIEDKYGTYCISRRPKIAPEAFALWIFPGIKEEAVQFYESIHNVIIPSCYKEVLHVINGVIIFNMELFGIPISMTKNPPLLDRSTVTPKDLSIANKDWKKQFRNIDSSLFYIGGAPLSFEENIGYFINEEADVFSFRENGLQVGQWTTINSFLAAEIKRAKEDFPKYEEMMNKIISEYSKKKNKK